ncbi:DNA replication and repair protein RecF [bacterium A37T11]|nr:DNA replication and repair protein RecF [bacterium A37T11]
MWLRQLSVLNFKNYEEAALEFEEGVNAFTGDNGAGKTNMLDAIHYLSLCKSYFNPIDSQQIRQDGDWFMIQGVFEKDSQEDVISCSLKKNQRKQFKRNKKEYQRLADHIGIYPLVMVSPNDAGIISEGSEERRRFMDNVISQTDNRYLDELIAYNKYLQNRNSLLKHRAGGGNPDPALLQVLNEQLVLSGTRIFERRKAFMTEFVPIFDQYYQYISGNAESVSLVYQSQLLQHDFYSLLEQSLPRDRVLERTTTGIHKDDLIFSIRDMPMKKFGSQGQQKSLVISLKLAQYRYLYLHKGYKPLLLLDDIFDKLDDKRVHKLMQMVSDDDFGQLFITDTNAERIKAIFAEISCNVRIFDIENGMVKQVDS